MLVRGTRVVFRKRAHSQHLWPHVKRPGRWEIIL